VGYIASLFNPPYAAVNVRLIHVNGHCVERPPRSMNLHAPGKLP
jgi:hypothetical protein